MEHLAPKRKKKRETITWRLVHFPFTERTNMSVHDEEEIAFGKEH